MTASICAASVVSFLDVCVGALYCAKLFRKQIAPRIATWLIFELGVMMSLAAYFASHRPSLVMAALNVTDAIVVTVVLASLLLNRDSGGIALTGNERLCLVISVLTSIAWAITKTPWIGFAGFQVVMSVAYVPTIESVWQWKPGRPPEPIETWSINAAAALIGVITDAVGHDALAMVYPLRALILCLTIVLLVWRWLRKSRDRAFPAR